MAMRVLSQGETDLNWLNKVNATVINSGNYVHAVQIVAASTPYVEAVCRAQKSGATATTTPAENTGVIFLCSAVNTLTASFKIASGATLVLPKYGNLNTTYLAVNTVNDAISILYTTEKHAT